MSSYEVYESKSVLYKNLFFMIFGDIVLGAFVIGFLRDFNSDDFLIFLLILCSFVLVVWATFIYIGRIRSNNPILVFEPEHLVLYQTPKRIIHFKWEDIEAFYPYQIRTQKVTQNFIGIILKNEQDYIDTLPKSVQKWAKFNIRTGYPAFSISLALIKKEQHEEVLKNLSATGIPLVTKK